MIDVWYTVVRTVSCINRFIQDQQEICYQDIKSYRTSKTHINSEVEELVCFQTE